VTAEPTDSRASATHLRGFMRNKGQSNKVTKGQRHKVRDKGKEGWLGVDYVPGVVASGGGLSGNFVPGGERLRVEPLVPLW
jgi:hypothetical protein